MGRDQRRIRLTGTSSTLRIRTRLKQIWAKIYDQWWARISSSLWIHRRAAALAHRTFKYNWPYGPRPDGLTQGPVIWPVPGTTRFDSGVGSYPCWPGPIAVLCLGYYLGKLGQHGPARSSGMRKRLIFNLCNRRHKE
uniref:Uncharacterized protein n=1 Tax=Oryza glumipatula TaxID=40148 RepID=A0A0D9ZBU2_9ORYZ